MSYALITGASSGIGRHYALQLAERGYNIIAVSNQPVELEAVATELTSRYGVETHTLCVNLAEQDAALDILLAARARAGMLRFWSATQACSYSRHS